MNETALTVQRMDLNETLTLGKVLAESGFFTDTKQASQAVVKVLAGAELGFGPIASMTGIHIVQGKPTVGANLMGAAIKGSGRYNYRVVDLSEQRAEIAFYENGTEVGRSVFTMDDARAAGLTGKSVWKQYPRNMLFSRAMSNGARWYCPDVFSGVTPYTPEEFDAPVNEDGEVIDVTPEPRGPTWTPEATAAGEDEPEQANGELVITSPAELLKAVNDATMGYYDAIPHMLNAIKKDTGQDYRWPDAGDREAYAVAYTVLCEHAEANAKK